MNNPRSELDPLVFTKQYSRCRYQSMLDFIPIRYRATVTQYSNRGQVQPGIAHPYLEEPHRVALYPAPHLACLSPLLPLAVLETRQPRTLIQNPEQ
jgi:hypothetical protein